MRDFEISATQLSLPKINHNVVNDHPPLSDNMLLKAEHSLAWPHARPASHDHFASQTAIVAVTGHANLDTVRTF